MKNLQESLKLSLNEDQEDDKFNEWLSKAYGYEDLYDYFRELLNIHYYKAVTKQNWVKLSEECYKEHTAPNIIRNAKKFRLDPEEVCDEVFRDWAI